jgi:hypothetical protein
MATTDMPPAPSSPVRLVNIHTTPDFSAPLKFDKALAPPREGCRAYLPEETASGRDQRQNEFDAFRREDGRMRGDASGQDNRQSEFDAFRREDERMRQDASRQDNRRREFDVFRQGDELMRRDASAP